LSCDTTFSEILLRSAMCASHHLLSSSEPMPRLHVTLHMHTLML
jgi:hypothetical protein